MKKMKKIKYGWYHHVVESYENRRTETILIFTIGFLLALILCGILLPIFLLLFR